MIKIAIIFCAALFFGTTIILDSYQTHVSTPIITSDRINYKQGDNAIISGWVNYNEEATSDVLLRIVATSPSEIKIFDEYVTSNNEGIFAIQIPISNDAEIGSYEIKVISQCREIHREICTHQYEALSINVEKGANQDEKIPDWIRNNAAWWAEGSIDDQTFVSGVEFFIEEGILSVQTVQSNEKTSDEIPDWIRNNAAWWAEGIISDFDFVKGIEYLVNNEIIQVKQTASIEIDSSSLDVDAGTNEDEIESRHELCLGDARCFSGTLVKMVDNDILQVDDDIVRLALVDAPKMKYDNGKARNFIEVICPVGSTVVVDQDDSQLEDKYGRILGVVYCNNSNLNKELLDIGLGDLYSAFCDQSEFRHSDWALKHGCES